MSWSSSSSFLRFFFCVVVLVVLGVVSTTTTTATIATTTTPSDDALRRWVEETAVTTAVSARHAARIESRAQAFFGESPELRYQNQTVRITMRDGVELFTVVYVPSGSEPVGTVLERTPYTTLYSLAGMRRWLPLGFAYILQDQRGTGFSHGDDFQFWRYDGQDGYDTMEWIASQSWSNGKVFLTGASAMGNAVVAGALYEPPWLMALNPIWATGAGHFSTYQNGAYRSNLVGKWLRLLLLGYVIDDIFEHEGFDEWWDPIHLYDKLDRCHWPGVTVSGWYDIFQNENIDAFNVLQEDSPDPACNGQHKIVVAPGGHCAVGCDVRWHDSATDIGDVLAEELFLRLGGLPVPDDLARRAEEADTVTIYVLGPDGTEVGNYWTTIPTWPTISDLSFYLNGNNTLSLTPPTVADDKHSFSYDPRDPVPMIGGPELFGGCGPCDQRDIEDREDVILFDSDPFTEHTALTGDIWAEIFVSSDQVDTDFTVKLTDVYPDGRSILLNDGIIRMRWRDDISVPTMMEPGEIYQVRVHLWKTSFIFEEGHRLRAAISSSNDRFEPNPNNGLPIEETGLKVTAVNTIFHDASHPSRIILPQVSLDDLPANFQP